MQYRLDCQFSSNKKYFTYPNEILYLFMASFSIIFLAFNKIDIIVVM